MQRRGRACIACSKLKIKCELGSTPNASPPCQRCVRLSKDCELVPIRRSKDRVAELESQVANLTKLLKAQRLRDANSVDPETGSSDVAQTSRTSRSGSEQSNDDATTYPSPAYNEALIERIDAIVSQPLQEKVCSRYLDEIVPSYPLVRPTGNGNSLLALRSDRALLLLAIMYAAGAAILASETLESLYELLLQELYSLARQLETKNQDFQFLQAVQITSLWYRGPKRTSHMSQQELVEISCRLTEEFGAQNSYSCQRREDGQGDANVEAATAWRASLVSHILSASFCMLTRQPNRHPWNERKEQCLFILDYARDDKHLDRWVAQYVRAEHLCEEIVQDMGNATDDFTCHSIGTTAYQVKLQECRDKMLNWRLQVPKSDQIPSVLFWESVATVYLQEHVLYTTTNKASFGAPFVANRLSINDFPCPPVTPAHELALLEMNIALYNIIDIFSQFDAATLTAFPGIMVGARAVYAVMVLAKLYIAVTAPGNTYGAVLGADSLQLYACIDKMQDARLRMVSYGDTSSAAFRVLGGVARLREWLMNFDSLQLAARADPASFTLEAPAAFGSSSNNSSNPQSIYHDSPLFGDVDLTLNQEAVMMNDEDFWQSLSVPEFMDSQPIIDDELSIANGFNF